MQILIKTHRINRTYHNHYFFILSKGNNAGKPLDIPCPNCFVVITKSSEERQLLYWLCFGLWQGNYFYQHLVGSVIPFLRLPELKSIIRETRDKVEKHKPEFDKAIDDLNKLRSLEENLSRQLQLAKQAKKCVMQKVLK
jgi:hypothetical protein